MMGRTCSTSSASLQLLLAFFALQLLVWRGVAAQPASSTTLQLKARDGEELGRLLAQIGQLGAPITITIAGNISIVDVPGPRPVPVRRNVTLRGIGLPEATEINLHGLYNAWKLDPGVVLTLQNLTLSNLAVRPPSEPSPPPANVSVFTFPMWFFESDRSADQIVMENLRLVIPYDEFLVVHHCLVEWETASRSNPEDMYTYFEHLLQENLRKLTCDCEGMLYAPRGEVHISYAEGLGVIMKHVDLQYKRNVYDVMSPRSNISASNPAFSASVPGYPNAPPAVPSGSLPGWAVAVIVICTVMFVLVVMAAIAGPRRLGLCLLGDHGPGRGKGPPSELISGPSMPSPSAKSGGAKSQRGLLTVLLPGGGGSSSGVEPDAAAMEEGALLQEQRPLGPSKTGNRTSGERGQGGLYLAQSSRSVSSTGGMSAGGAAGAKDRDTALDQLHAAVAELNREVDDKSLIIHEVLGQGAYGTVYRGTWRNLPVAVKTVVFQDRACGSEKAQKRAIMEAAITSSVSHPNVVATLSYDLQPLHSHGVPTHTGNLNLHQAQVAGQVTDWKLFLVQEYCNGGSLRQAVDGRSIYWDSAHRQPKIREILTTALEIARGMEHLHSKHIVHGDLTPNNVLLSNELVHVEDAAAAAAAGGGPGAGGDCSAAAGGAAGGDEGRRGSIGGRLSFNGRLSASSPYPSAGSATLIRTAKIADFGLSVKMPEGASHVSNMRQGTPFYVAPEVLRRGNMTKASDVYSFGVLLWEMYHCKPPYKRSGRQGFVLRRGFPLFGDCTPMRFRQLANACMAQAPRTRPQFSQIKAELLDLLSAPPEQLAVGPPPAAAAPAGDPGAPPLPPSGGGGSGGGGGFGAGSGGLDGGGGGNGCYPSYGSTKGGGVPVGCVNSDNGYGAGWGSSAGPTSPGARAPAGPEAPPQVAAGFAEIAAAVGAPPGAQPEARGAGLEPQQQQQEYYQMQQQRLRGLEAHMEQQRLQLQALQQQQQQLQALQAQQEAAAAAGAGADAGLASEPLSGAGVESCGTGGSGGERRAAPPTPGGISGTSGSAMAEVSPEYLLPIELRHGPFLTSTRRPSAVLEDSGVHAVIAAAAMSTGTSGRLPGLPDGAAAAPAAQHGGGGQGVRFAPLPAECAGGGPSSPHAPLQTVPSTPGSGASAPPTNACHLGAGAKAPAPGAGGPYTAPGAAGAAPLAAAPRAAPLAPSADGSFDTDELEDSDLYDDEDEDGGGSASGGYGGGGTYSSDFIVPAGAGSSADGAASEGRPGGGGGGAGPAGGRGRQYSDGGDETDGSSYSDGAVVDGSARRLPTLPA